MGRSVSGPRREGGRRTGGGRETGTNQRRRMTNPRLAGDNPRALGAGARPEAHWRYLVRRVERAERALIGAGIEDGPCALCDGCGWVPAPGRRVERCGACGGPQGPYTWPLTDDQHRAIFDTLRALAGAEQRTTDYLAGP